MKKCINILLVIISVMSIMSACNKKVNYEKLYYSETDAGCYINVEELEFPIDMSVYDCLKDPKPIRKKQQAFALVVKLLEELHDRGKIVNFDLIYVNYCKKNGVWFCTYTREIGPDSNDWLFNVAIDSNTGEVIAAWVEE